MRLPAQFAIRHNGDKTRWLSCDVTVATQNNNITRDNMALLDEFTVSCLFSARRARALLNRTVDDRYELFKVSLTGTKVEK